MLSTGEHSHSGKAFSNFVYQLISINFFYYLSLFTLFFGLANDDE